MLNPLRRSALYVAEGKPTLIAPVHFNSAGICYEEEGPLIAEQPTWSVVAKKLRAALDRFSFKEANLRDHRSEDWPSYRASGARSVRQFEESYLCIHVVAVNAAELFFDAYCQPHNEADISLHVTLNPHGKDEEMGRLLGRLYTSCQRWPEVTGS